MPPARPFVHAHVHVLVFSSNSLLAHGSTAPSLFLDRIALSLARCRGAGNGVRRFMNPTAATGPYMQV